MKQFIFYLRRREYISRPNFLEALFQQPVFSYLLLFTCMRFILSSAFLIVAPRMIVEEM